MASLTFLVSCRAYDLHSRPDALWEQSQKMRENYEEATIVLVLSCLPLVIAWSAASVSSECARLTTSLARLNFRPAHEYEGSWREEQERISPLQERLSEANGGNGLGFMIPIVSMGFDESTVPLVSINLSSENLLLFMVRSPSQFAHSVLISQCAHSVLTLCSMFAHCLL